MLRLIVPWLLFVPFAAIAGGRDGTGKTCPNRGELIHLCISVDKLIPDDDPDSIYVYRYQRIIDEAACANYVEDERSAYQRKVQELWRAYPDAFVCSFPSFDVHHGSILKLAVRSKFKDFIVQSANVWKLDLNDIDKSDSRTLLDYVSKEIQVNRGTVSEPDLRHYYEILRKAGAKHASEL